MHHGVIYRADALFNSARMEDLLEYLRKYEDSDNADVQWRLARAYYKVSNLSTTQRKDAEQLAYKAREHITKALELDSSSYACHEVSMILHMSIADAASLPCFCGPDPTHLLAICICSVCDVTNMRKWPADGCDLTHKTSTTTHTVVRPFVCVSEENACKYNLAV